MNKEVNNYRLNHQKTELRRDFDLYDPEKLKKSRPLREGDDEDDDELGPASAQKYTAKF